MTRGARALAALALVACGCGSSGRYRLATDPYSRYAFKYVQDRESGLWVHRECEVRVSARRKLPEPITDDAHGDQLHSSKFTPESVETGGLVPGQFELQDGWRVWRFRDLAHADDLDGKVGLGVQIEWVKPGGPSEWEPMEIFVFPPFGDTPPDTWSAWQPATSRREGGFAFWSEVQGAAPEPIPPGKFPFELRWRLLLKDHVYVD